MKFGTLSTVFPNRLPSAGWPLASLCCLALLTLLPACGKKGPLQPLSGIAPAAPENTQIIQQGDSLLLSWQLPAGETAGEIHSYRIDRLAYTAEDGCPSCRDPQETMIRINLQAAEAAQQVRQRLYWRDNHVVAGRGYVYRIVPEAFGGRLGEAATVYRVILPAPAPPPQLRGSLDLDRVVLTWDPPPTLPAGARPTGYNVYRRALSGLFLPVPLNPEPLEIPQVVDRGLEAGQVYAYRVTALIRIGDELVESRPSAVLEVTLPDGSLPD